MSTATSDGSRAADSVACQSCRVLVVDDNRDLAEVLGMLLVGLGHTVRVVFDGPTALEAAREFAPEVVFLDIGLPRMNGYEVARRLRNLELAHRPYIVAVSGHGLPQDREQSANAGFDDHLLKPVPFPELARIVEQSYASVRTAIT